ncbi:hypothetical protein LOTGIDRAFT_175891 [Lottia gigantea]|uniref:CCHC-type domain-containing protein n=1 Tax=Lottia gigantea TaxID=225164 RepID=V3ZV25_LOTGI|nr:hypothetical protein LOTGIDRAFT_175891 [Lottia gigantea]ESO88227.1 hypothetical protein LOTGIDRAFT_175891 [Lottia gigantea]
MWERNIILQGRPPVCLKCYKAGHFRKECPLGKQPSYANALFSAGASVSAGARKGAFSGADSIKGRPGFVQASTIVSKPSRLPRPAVSPPPPPTHVTLYIDRLGGDGFYTPKNNAKKRTSSESNLVSVNVANSSHEEIVSTKKFAFQPLTPPNKKDTNLQSAKFVCSAAGANSVRLKSNVPSASKSSVGRGTDDSSSSAINIIAADVILTRSSGDMPVEDTIVEKSDSAGISDFESEMDQSGSLHML